MRVTINLQCESYIENDLFQKDVEFIANTTSIIRIPFADFTLTTFGYEREVQRLSDTLQVESVGLLITSQNQYRQIFQQSEGSSDAREQPVLEEQSSNGGTATDEEDELVQREKKSFSFDIEILSITALSHEEEAARHLEDRKNYLKHAMNRDKASSST